MVNCQLSIVNCPWPLSIVQNIVHDIINCCPLPSPHSSVSRSKIPVATVFPTRAATMERLIPQVQANTYPEQECSAQCSAQCSAVQCSALWRCSAVQRSAAQCSAAQCSAVQRRAVQRSAVYHFQEVTMSALQPEMRTFKRSKTDLSLNMLSNYKVLYCTVLYCTVLYCTVLYCTVLYCTVLYCTVLYCTVLYCTVLWCKCTAMHRRKKEVLCYIRLDMMIEQL